MYTCNKLRLKWFKKSLEWKKPPCLRFARMSSNQSTYAWRFHKGDLVFSPTIPHRFFRLSRYGSPLRRVYQFSGILLLADLFISLLQIWVDTWRYLWDFGHDHFLLQFPETPSCLSLLPHFQKLMLMFCVSLLLAVLLRLFNKSKAVLLTIAHCFLFVKILLFQVLL